MPEYTKEQERAASQMHLKAAYLYAIEASVRYMEGKLGMVHSVVVEFRKGQLQNARDEFEKARKQFEDLGGIQTAIEMLNQGGER